MFDPKADNITPLVGGNHLQRAQSGCGFFPVVLQRLIAVKASRGVSRSFPDQWRMAEAEAFPSCEIAAAGVGVFCALGWTGLLELNVTAGREW